MRTNLKGIDERVKRSKIYLFCFQRKEKRRGRKVFQKKTVENMQQSQKVPSMLNKNKCKF